MKLASLSPRIMALDGHTQAIGFLCPRCLRRQISVVIWSGRAGDTVIDGVTRRLWHAEQGPNRDWDTLTITPSIDQKHSSEDAKGGCPGWHGSITNGEVTT